MPWLGPLAPGWWPVPLRSHPQHASTPILEPLVRPLLLLASPSPGKLARLVQDVVFEKGQVLGGAELAQGDGHLPTHQNDADVTRPKKTKQKTMRAMLKVLQTHAIIVIG